MPFLSNSRLRSEISNSNMAPRKQDLLIIADATASMSTYLLALQTSLPEVLALSKLSGAFNRIGVLAYRDYSESQKDILEWSGWNDPKLIEFASKIRPMGGGDFPEATKSALNRALELCDEKKHTLVLLYTDAPPHSILSNSRNAEAERKKFPRDKSDWVKLTYAVKEKNTSVFCFVPALLDESYRSFYVFLSQVTGGQCIVSPAKDSKKISHLTLDVVIQWSGLFDWNNVEQEPRQHELTFVCRFFDDPLDSRFRPASEKDDSHHFFATDNRAAKSRKDPLDLAKNIPVGPVGQSASSMSASKRFADPSEHEYRATVYSTLDKIINANVVALTYNPVFGQLWRAVCKGPECEEKATLVNAFSAQVGKTTDSQQKAELNQWLEDSFDASEEIEQMITKADPEKSAPRVYLDLDSGVELTRRELLEVSKSCYAGVLQKLATIFTHLKILEKGVVLAPKQRSIPLSLSPRDFFRVLPHLVVAGTIYPPRAASLTAILALVTGVPFLESIAKDVLAKTKGSWLNLEVPENVSYECARFLLSAPDGLVLTKDERTVYEAMRRYKLIELNLDSSLNVELPWTPDKTRNVGDCKILCGTCGIRRSVTIMSHQEKDVCGLCMAAREFKTVIPKDYAESDDLNSCWVECITKSCRAQYIVEDVPRLNVRPKCHYCRKSVPCPWVECVRCANRVVIPEIYRDSSTSQYLCPACSNPARTKLSIATVETTAKALVAENGNEWLGISENPDLLKGKSAFKLVQAHGFEVFKFDQPKLTSYEKKHGRFVELKLGEKKVHNASNVVAQVEARIGKGEVELHSCPLCFNDMASDKLIPTCGRKGCKYKVDEACLKQWYGANEAGKILNLMQTVCPFCRRAPATKVLSRFNRGVAALGGLRDAIDDRAWYYAWCTGCGFAKRAYERQCCEGARLPDVLDFRCEDCQGRRASDKSRITPCPSCGVMVEKEYGCNHITCQCGQHFCHVCGKGESEATIYKHLSEEHGSFYDLNDDEGGYDDDYYESD